MDGSGLTKQRHTGWTVSRRVSTKIAAKALRLFNLAGVAFKSLAPVRRLMQRRKPAQSVDSGYSYAKFAKSASNMPVVRESRTIGSSFVKVQVSLGMNNTSERAKLAYKYRRHNVLGITTVSRLSRTGRSTSSRRTGVRLYTGQIATRRSTLIRQQLALGGGENKEDCALLRKDLNPPISSAKFAAPAAPLIRLKGAFLHGILNFERKQDGVRASQNRSHYKMQTKKILNLSNYGNSETQRSVTPNNPIRSREISRRYPNQMQDHVAPVLQSNNAIHQSEMPPSSFGLQRHQIGEIVRELLTADVRRPPSGVAAFDARSAPIWPGRKPGF